MSCQAEEGAILSRKKVSRRGHLLARLPLHIQCNLQGRAASRCCTVPCPVQSKAQQQRHVEAKQWSAMSAPKLQSRSLPKVSLPFLKLSLQLRNCLGSKHLLSKLSFKPPFSFQRPRMVLISSLPPSTFLATSSSAAL